MIRLQALRVFALLVIAAVAGGWPGCSQDGNPDGDTSPPPDGDQETGEEPPPDSLSLPFFFPPTAPAGQPLEVSFAARGGTPPYHGWEVLQGELPPGTALDPSSGRLIGAPRTEGVFPFVVAVRDAAGATAAELFGIRIGPPQSEGAMASKARRYLEIYEGRHLWGGLSFNMMTPDDPDGNYRLSTCGDSAFQSGQCTLAMAFRHAVEGSPASLATIREQVTGFRRFMKITGVPGLIGRCYAHEDTPMEESHFRTFWPDDPDSHNYRGEGEFSAYRWLGSTSKDQVSGAVLGLSAAYDLVDDPEVRQAAREFLTELADHVWDNGLKIVDRNGEVTEYGNLSPWDWEGTGLCTGLEAVCLLAWIKAAAHVSGEPRFAERYRQLLEEPPPAVPGIVCDETMLDILRKYMWVYAGYATKYYNAYMAFENFYILQRLERDPVLFDQFRDIFRDTLWLNLDDRTVNRRGAVEDNPTKTAWYLFSTGERDPRALQRAVWQTVVFPEPPLRDRRVVNSTDPDIEKNPARPEESLYPLPSYRRVPDMVIWHRNPFALDGGEDSGEERTGCDYLLPYWMGRYYGYISGEW